MQEDDEPPKPGPGRRPWVTVLLFVLPWALGLVVLLSAIAWGLRQRSSSDVRAVAGALGIWLDENFVLVAYLGCRYALLTDSDGFWPRVRPTVVKWGRLFAAAGYVSPGLWIGWAARDPLSAALATRLATQLIWFLNSLRLPPAVKQAVNDLPALGQGPITRCAGTRALRTRNRPR